MDRNTNPRQQNNNRRNMSNQSNEPKEAPEFEEKVIQINRVSKKTKGGNKMGFSVLMVVGDRKGRVGVGLGKSNDVMSAIKKGSKKAKKKLITVPMDGTTIPFAITVKRGSGKVMLKPAPKGSGVIAGGPVRAVVDAAGIRDISSKILGSGTQSGSVYATFKALTEIKNIVALKGLKLKSIVDVEREEAKKLAELNKKAEAVAKEHLQREKEQSAKVAAKKVVKQVVTKKAVLPTKAELKVAEPKADVAK